MLDSDRGPVHVLALAQELALHPVAIGCKAHAALLRSAGVIEPLADLNGSRYARAAGEIIWIGDVSGVMHPRAVVLRSSKAVARAKRLHPGALSPWTPPALRFDASTTITFRHACALLVRDVRAVGAPQGFGRMLAGEAPSFPFAAMSLRVHALMDCFAANDAEAVFQAALPLLGLGPGLTPAGDDLVGAALFIRQAMAQPMLDRQRWKDIAARLGDIAPTRSSAIGAALFQDLLAGESFVSLHRLVSLLMLADHQRAIAAARELVAIGSSSGWDMLAGLIIGSTGELHSIATEHDA